MVDNVSRTARITGVAPMIAKLPEGAVVIDASNYYPFRDAKIEAIEAGQVESVWVVEQLGARLPRHGTRLGPPLSRTRLLQPEQSAASLSP